MMVATIKGTETADYGISRFFSESNFQRLQCLMYTKKAEAGSNLFWEGDAASKLYYIRSGRVKLRKTTEDGKEFILSILQKGDLIGELGGFDESFYSFSAEVSETAELGVIQVKDLEIILYQHGDFAVQFTKWMGLMHRVTQSKFRDLMLYGKPGALASTLIRMSNSYGVACEDGIRINVKLSNTELAEMIGTTREGVNRMLSSLKGEGTISMERGTIMIHRLSDLRGICNCPSFPECPLEVCRI